MIDAFAAVLQTICALIGSICFNSSAGRSVPIIPLELQRALAAGLGLRSQISLRSLVIRRGGTRRHHLHHCGRTGPSPEKGPGQRGLGISA
ncbi:hypothetical protein AOLI_G00325690 [Acnodon oligacanthus]